MNEFRRLFKYLRPHYLTFALAIFAMVLTALFETATGALLVPMLDQFQTVGGGGSSTLFNIHEYIPQGRENWYQAWLVIAGLLLAFTVLKGITAYFASYLMAKIGQSVILELRQQLYDHLLAQPAAFFEKHRTNFLVARLVTSCAAIETSVSANLRDVLRETFMLIAFVSAAFYFNWRLMLGALIIGPVIAYLTTLFSRALKELSEVSLKGNQSLTDTAQETISNQTVVKAYSAEERERKRFAGVAELIARANLRSGKISALSPPTIELISIIAIVVFFYFGLREINYGNMEAPQFFAFLFFLFRSYEPMRKLSRQHNELSRALAAAEDVWEVLDDSEDLPVRKDARKLGPLSKEVRLDNVSFGYRDGGSEVLKGIDLEIPKGRMVALVGESGSGKSSLIKLVQRLYDPASGSVTWDGVDLRDADLISLRRQIALVMQETVLFNETVAYNITYGKPDADQEAIREAARVAFADEFIEELPHGYDTLVGERGSSLSGGQRQRIAIARAVLADSSLLILDEATSALDTESEKLVQKALANLTAGRTSIVIAHRLSTVRQADKIVVMRRGRIVETGTHDELMALDGAYKRLYELQFADETTN
ncbi:MAG: ABC transporter ATP-binding protein [Acidobacteria bacterium]|nr:MAG: ABC transporter ATP-binding protein [Acidobacteriota bacterium]REK01572.1 MAG: ABC transporter ATP-binding protein [Acidobacteriota bacterium]REK14528.1 MAG: ABC transporter ATP-binding protein [Acidobacteriota bacterium]REK45243.1 MAG: ABC transporter ATP-binding protein [Acidobacteriota bacterium]